MDTAYRLELFIHISETASILLITYGSLYAIWARKRDGLSRWSRRLGKQIYGSMYY
jgi:hypothetical protein